MGANSIDVVASRIEAEKAGAAVDRVTGRNDAALVILGVKTSLYEPVQTDEQKAFATVRAQAALRGIVVVQLRDDHGRPEWVASMGARTKAFSNLDDLARWVALVDGKRA